MARPSSLVQAAEIIASSAHVKPVGSLHSFTGIVRSEGTTLVTDRLPRDVRWVGEDPARPGWHRVRVEGHQPMKRAMDRMNALGLALDNSGSNVRPSVIGALATATHGSGEHWPGLAHPRSVLAVEGIDGRGNLFRRDSERPEDHADLRALRGNLGGLGLVTAVELSVRRAYRLRMDGRLGTLAQALDPVERAPALRRYEVLWWPLDEVALRLYRDETLEPLTMGRGLSAIVDEIIVGNLALGTLLKGAWALGGGEAVRRVWSWILPNLPEDDTDYVDTWVGGLTGVRWFRAVSLEAAVPAHRLGEALEVVARLASEWHASGRYTVDLPVNVRWSQSDGDTCMSAAHGRATAWVDVSATNFAPPEKVGPFLAAVDEALTAFDSRSHPGKVHWCNPKSRWDPECWSHYWQVRDRFDPEQKFLSAHLRALRDGVDLDPGLPRF
ncbi:MAG: D-arabinono-1,4-lactone oxidase [Myxococcota bacterium]